MLALQEQGDLQLQALALRAVHTVLRRVGGQHHAGLVAVWRANRQEAYITMLRRNAAFGREQVHREQQTLALQRLVNLLARGEVKVERRARGWELFRREFEREAFYVAIERCQAELADVRQAFPAGIDAKTMHVLAARRGHHREVMSRLEIASEKMGKLDDRDVDKPNRS
jgi:hypothetical protein